MSKKRRDKMKAKAARHAKQPPQQEQGPALAAAASKRAETGSRSKLAAHMKLDPKQVPHLRGMSPQWRSFYEEVARAARD